MENLDIEKLSRELPYNLPEDTFKIVQSNVLEKTLRNKQAPIFNLKWIYAAAAVILLIVGANFLINTNANKDNLENVQLTARNEIVTQQKSAPQTFVNQGNGVAQNAPDENTDDVLDTTDLTSAPVSHLNVKKQLHSNANLASSNQLKTTTPTEAQIDAVLDGFSSSEIASLSNNSEQDVYLDLYN